MTTTQKAVKTGSQTPTPRVSIVLPVFNEAGNLRSLAMELHELQQTPRWTYEVLWVNDGSTDDSAEVLASIVDDFAGHRALHLARNRGQSAALAAGIDHASGGVIVTMDADGQNDPVDVPGLVETLVDGGFDCVSGVRDDRQDGLAKRIPSRIQTALTRRMAPGAGSDMGCTLKAFRADALAELELRGEHHRYIPAKLAQRGYRLTERDVNHRERQHGSSHYGAGRLLRGFLDALYHLLLIRWGTRPIHLFGGLGVGLLGVGLLLGGHMLVERLLLGNPIAQHMPRLLLISLLVLSGLLVTGLGVLAELLTRLLYRDERPYRVAEVEG